MLSEKKKQKLIELFETCKDEFAAYFVLCNVVRLIQEKYQAVAYKRIKEVKECYDIAQAKRNEECK